METPRKRQRDSSSSGPSASSSSGRGARRTKNVQACASCRKHKTRCEILDGVNQPIIRCHRCKTLEVECSYQEMDRSTLELSRPAVQESSAPTSVNSVTHERNLQLLSGYSGTATPANAPGTSNASLPIDLYPNKPQTIWDFMHLPQGSLDWSAPVEAMQELMKKQSISVVSQPSLPISNDSLDNILSPDQILHLSSIFEQNYLPWLNFIPIRDSHSPFLDLVYCTIASRHLDKATRSVVAPRLQALITDRVSKMIFQSVRSETLESIQCLLILSLWAPICDTEEDFRDGRLLVASAVSISHNMRLNEACQLVTTLHDKRAKGEDVAEHEMADAVNKTRLWIAITNIESLLCTGSARNPLSKRTAAYLTIFPLALNPPSDRCSGQDLRLRLMAEMFDITEAGMAINLKSLSDIDLNLWYDGYVHALSNISRVARILLPLAVVVEYDMFYFKILNILVRTCRSLVLYSAFSSARAYFLSVGDDNPFWFRDVRPHGQNVLIQWSKECLSILESVLVLFLEIEVGLLGTSPDYMFCMIAFAASYIIGCKFLVAHSFNFNLPGSGEKLIAKCISRLRQISFSSESAAGKCATFISRMLGLWENQSTSTSPHKEPEPILPSADFQDSHIHQTTAPTSDSGHSSSPQSIYQLPTTPEPMGMPSLPLPLPHSQPSPSALPVFGDVDWFNPELFKDSAFWSDLFSDSSGGFGGALEIQLEP